MKKLVVVLLLLCSAYCWGGEKKPVKDDARKEAVEDICFAYAEFNNAGNEFRNNLDRDGGYTTGSSASRLAQVQDTKRKRLLSLQDRYVKRYGNDFILYPAAVKNICNNTNGR